MGHLPLSASGRRRWTICPLRGVTGTSTASGRVSSDVHAPPARATVPAGTVPAPVTTAVTVSLPESTSRSVASDSTTRTPREDARVPEGCMQDPAVDSPSGRIEQGTPYRAEGWEEA